MGRSLEWATSCPPPRHNFHALPGVGVALFFLVTDVLYAAWSKEPAGIAALTVAFAMRALSRSSSAGRTS
jgi:hypothetical protein